MNKKRNLEKILEFNRQQQGQGLKLLTPNGVPTKDDEYCYCTTWRKNIVAVITRDTAIKTI